MSALPVIVYSDVLCIWAYVAQARLDEIRATHGGDVAVEHRFVSVFGDTAGKMAASWQGRDGFAGYARHVQSIAARFPHVTLSPRAWSEVRPASSLSPHLYLRAVGLWEHGQYASPPPALPIFESVAWAFRRGFFAEARDVGQHDVQSELAAPYGVPQQEIDRLLSNGSAHAALASDYQSAEKARIEGSPTLVLNEGRQKLYGNVGFRVIDANIRELLREPNPDNASWC